MIFNTTLIENRPDLIKLQISVMKTAVQTKTAKKILIVEDEGEMCLLLNILLHGEKMELDHVQSISKAKEYLANENPSVVILDNKLPDGFGIDFLSYIKENYPSIRVIMMSGYDLTGQESPVEKGAEIFLKKPFTRDELYQSIMHS